MSEQPLLQIRDLSVSFPTRGEAGGRRGPARRVRAVNSVNITIYPRQTVAVVGESGCGKSVTALSTLQLVPVPPGSYDQGSILWLDEDTSQPIDLLRLSDRRMRAIRGNQIAMIFQEPMTSLNPVYTIGDQIIEAVLLHQNVSKRAAIDIAAKALSDVGIADARSRLSEYPHQMSGGMRQRIMIAMALACQPRLLLADEPTTALDVTIQAQILELLRELQQRHGMSIMLITHDLGVVAENADVVAVMYAGRIVEYGSVQDIFDDPLHPYTQGLFSSMPVIGKTHDRLVTIPGNVPNPSDLPSGCAFHTRCARTRELAATAGPELTTHVTIDGEPVTVLRDTTEQVPPLLEVKPQHWVACLHTEGFEAGRPTRPDLAFRKMDALAQA